MRWGTRGKDLGPLVWSVCLRGLCAKGGVEGGKRRKDGLDEETGARNPELRTDQIGKVNECRKKVPWTRRRVRDKLMQTQGGWEEGASQYPERDTHIVLLLCCHQMPVGPPGSHYLSPIAAAALWKRRDYNWNLRKITPWALFPFKDVPTFFIYHPYKFLWCFWTSNKTKPGI